METTYRRSDSRSVVESQLSQLLDTGPDSLQTLVDLRVALVKDFKPAHRRGLSSELVGPSIPAIYKQRVLDVVCDTSPN